MSAELKNLNSRLAREGVAFECGRSDLAAVRLSWQGNSAVMYLLGAQVTSWSGKDTGEHIFLSRDAIFQPGKAIRGGIPLCYPQFGALGSLPQHGFARNTIWQAVASSSAPEGVSVTLELDDREGKLWKDCPTSARLRVFLGEALSMQLTMTNHSAGVIEITHAFHAYFKVGDISQTRIEGLSGVTYIDKVADGKTIVETSDLIEVTAETDRVYLNAPDILEIRDSARQLLFIVEKTRQQDAVLWNPWSEKARAMKDFGDDEFRHMVCLETGNIGSPLRINGGESVTVEQLLRVKRTS